MCQCVIVVVDVAAVIFMTMSLSCHTLFVCHANAVAMTPKSFFVIETIQFVVAAVAVVIITPMH